MKKKEIILCLILMMACIMAGCNKKVDKEMVNAIAGEYQAEGQDTGVDEEYVGSYWHLYIGNNEEEKSFLTIYDNGAGNPGVEGEIVSMTDSMLSIKVDQDMFEELPSTQWNLNGGKLELTYEIKEDAILLTNNDFTISFRKEGALKTIACHWKAENEKSLQSISFEDEQVCLIGWICYSDTECSKENITYWLDQACIFVDDCFEHMEVDQKTFLSLLDREDASNTVIELDLLDDVNVVEVRMVTKEDSCFMN